MRPSARVILQQDGAVALIRRVREGMTYYVFPGGGVEPGETPAQAATREAMEELGLVIRPYCHVATNIFRGNPQHYFTAEIIGGQFGTGTGEELTSSRETPRGTYEPIWLPLTDLGRHDVRPRWLAEALAGGRLMELAEPIEVIEA